MIALRHILVPTDFSEPAGAALRYARELAAQFHAHLHLLHVVPEPYAYPWGTEFSALSLTSLLAQSETAARERLTALVPGLDLPRDRVVTSAAIGSPVDRILGYISDQAIDLVVIGTHGRGMVGHLLLGSVTERIVRRSPVPVLTVHAVPDPRAAATAG